MLFLVQVAFHMVAATFQVWLFAKEYFPENLISSNPWELEKNRFSQIGLSESIHGICL